MSPILVKREDLGEPEETPEFTPWTDRPVLSYDKSYVDDFSGDLDEDGLPDGKGKCELSQGDIYDGDWKKGFPHGFGTWRWTGFEEGGDEPIGGIFRGDWELGEPVRGTYEWENGDQYLGEAGADGQHGKGKYMFDNGDWWEGEWFCGSRDGGIHYFSDGGRLEVLWEDGGIYGHGVLYYSNGNRYEGEFGSGLWPDMGEEFECFHGEGILYYTNKEPLVGIWEKGLFDKEYPVKSISVEYFEELANNIVKSSKDHPASSVRLTALFQKEIKVALEKSECTPTRREGLLAICEALEKFVGPLRESDDDERPPGPDYV